MIGRDRHCLEEKKKKTSSFSSNNYPYGKDYVIICPISLLEPRYSWHKDSENYVMVWYWGKLDIKTHPLFLSFPVSTAEKTGICRKEVGFACIIITFVVKFHLLCCLLLCSISVRIFPPWLSFFRRCWDHSPWFQTGPTSFSQSLQLVF